MNNPVRQALMVSGNQNAGITQPRINSAIQCDEAIILVSHSAIAFANETNAILLQFPYPSSRGKKAYHVLSPAQYKYKLEYQLAGVFISQF